MSEIQRADPNARRAAVAIIGCGTLVGVALIAVVGRFRPEFENWLKQDLSARLIHVAVAVTILTTLPLLGVAAYLWHLGRRILRVHRYPPPGLRLLNDTPVLTGPDARRRGRLIQGFAIVLGVAALFLAVLIWRLVASLRAA